MSHRLKKRQEKIQEKRRQTPWREFVMEICSWMPLNLYSIDEGISRYPKTERSGAVINQAMEEGNDLIEEKIFNSCVFEGFKVLRAKANKSLTTKDISWENAVFADGVYGAKNVYLSFSVGDECKNILYSWFVMSNCIDVIGSVSVVNNSGEVYHSFSVSNSKKIFFSRFIADSSNIYFSTDLMGCDECILCNSLQNEKYCIGNERFSKEEYFAIKENVLSDNAKLMTLFQKHLADHKSILVSENVEGNGINKSKNIQFGLLVEETKDARNVIMTNQVQNVYDGLDVGLNSSDIYGAAGAGDGSFHKYCVIRSGRSSNIYYSYHLVNCSYCLGCIGLKNKSYCIFNKQYTKEERYDKVDEIFTQMEKDGDLGKFFPGSMNPFYFNDTAAYLIDDSFTKEEVEAKGYLWRDEPITVDIPAGVQTVSVDELDEYEGWRSKNGEIIVGSSGDSSLRSEGQEWWIDPEIMKKVIVDEEGNAYRVIPMEYEF